MRGSIYSVAATRPDGHTPPGFNLELARNVRAAVSAACDPAVPIVAQGSIVDPDQAERALTDGAADAVEMTRAQISDAELVDKIGTGEPARIRPCALSNQRSQVRDNRNPIVTSLGDPFSGHETEDQPVDGGRLARSVTVVGGGPAGLEAARVAALRGHSVRLLEASEQFGGAVRSAERGPGWERLGLLVEWLERECRHEGVELVAGHRAAPDELATIGAHVIVATGGRPGRATTTSQGRAGARGRGPGRPPELPEGPVLVWDPIGGPIAVSVAELLAARVAMSHWRRRTTSSATSSLDPAIWRQRTRGCSRPGSRCTVAGCCGR